MTCDAAIQILERRGLLAPAEPRKPRRIVDLGFQDKKSAKRDVETLLLIIDKYEQDATCPILIGIREFWLKEFGDVRVVKEDLARFKDPQERLKRWIGREKADCLLLYVAPIVWAEAAHATGLPTHMLGGARDKEGTFTGSGFELGSDMISLLERLSKLGHQRIISPTHMSRNRLRKAMIRAYVEVFGGVETDYEKNVPVFHEADPKVWQSYWTKVFLFERPTAVIVENAKALQSLYGFCFVNRVRIPQDLSVVCVTNERELEWVYPLPTRMRFPSEKAVRHFRRWAEGNFAKSKFKIIPLEWEEGDTIAPPRKDSVENR
jgi:DNA-binding LacI/PurR family transcriptional regulator